MPTPQKGQACRLSPPCNLGAKGWEGGNKRPVIEVAWNNKYTHSFKHGSPHPGESGKTLHLTSQHPPPTLTPDSSLLSCCLERKHRPFDRQGLVSSGLTALPGLFESFQTLFYFRSRKFMKVKIGGSGRGRGKAERGGWGQLVAREVASDLCRTHWPGAHVLTWLCGTDDEGGS